MIDPCDSNLLVDLYQLTMLQAYFHERLDQSAVFEFFVRRLPESRNFLIAAGLEQVLVYLEGLRFTEEEIAALREDRRFSDDFIGYLASLRFTGEVHAMPEGTVFFPDEPVLRITAPLGQAQLVESRIINLLHYQTLIASKAARCVLVAPGKTLVDFGMRRAHGAEAGLLAARASYLAGFAGTATVLAGTRFGIPTFGTMAHSYVQVHDDEAEAFERFAQANPGNVTLLIDTFDTEAGARIAAALARRLAMQGIAIQAVRIDSGDLAVHAERVRKILNDAGMLSVKVFASGNLDEYSVRELVDRPAPIDGFGIGTRLDVSADAPYLDCAYKLEEFAGKARRKRSEGKATWPGRKQVHRHFEQGLMEGDLVTLESESAAGEPLLRLVMRGGKRLHAAEPLASIRQRVATGLAQLPPGLRRLEKGLEYRVDISPALRKLAVTLDAETHLAD